MKKRTLSVFLSIALVLTSLTPVMAQEVASEVIEVEDEADIESVNTDEAIEDEADIETANADEAIESESEEKIIVDEADAETTIVDEKASEEPAKVAEETSESVGYKYIDEGDVCYKTPSFTIGDTTVYYCEKDKKYTDDYVGNGTDYDKDDDDAAVHEATAFEAFEELGLDLTEQSVLTNLKYTPNSNNSQGGVWSFDLNGVFNHSISSSEDITINLTGDSTIESHYDTLSSNDIPFAGAICADYKDIKIVASEGVAKTLNLVTSVGEIEMLGGKPRYTIPAPMDCRDLSINNANVITKRVSEEDYSEFGVDSKYYLNYAELGVCRNIDIKNGTVGVDDSCDKLYGTGTTTYIEVYGIIKVDNDESHTTLKSLGTDNVCCADFDITNCDMANVSSLEANGYYDEEEEKRSAPGTGKFSGDIAFGNNSNVSTIYADSLDIDEDCSVTVSGSVFVADELKNKGILTSSGPICSYYYEDGERESGGLVEISVATGARLDVDITSVDEDTWFDNHSDYNEGFSSIPTNATVVINDNANIVEYDNTNDVYYISYDVENIMSLDMLHICYDAEALCSELSTAQTAISSSQLKVKGSVVSDTVDKISSEGWKYDKSANTLTLNGYSDNDTSSDSYASILAKGDLNIIVEGEDNVFACSGNAIKVNGKANISGGGTIKIKTANNLGINGVSELNIEDTTIVFDATGFSTANLEYEKIAKLCGNIVSLSNVTVQGDVLNDDTYENCREIHIGGKRTYITESDISNVHSVTQVKSGVISESQINIYEEYCCDSMGCQGELLIKDSNVTANGRICGDKLTVKNSTLTAGDIGYDEIKIIDSSVVNALYVGGAENDNVLSVSVEDSTLTVSDSIYCCKLYMKNSDAKTALACIDRITVDGKTFTIENTDTPKINDWAKIPSALSSFWDDEAVIDVKSGKIDITTKQYKPLSEYCILSSGCEKSVDERYHVVITPKVENPDKIEKESLSVGKTATNLTVNPQGAASKSKDGKLYTVKKKKDGTVKSIKLNPLVKKGYKFKGWFLNGKKVTTVSEKIAKKAGGNVELVAKFDPLKYTVKFDKGKTLKGAKVTMKAIKKTAYSETATITIPTTGFSVPKGSTATLVGFTKTKNGTSVDYKLGDTVKLADIIPDKGTTVKLYAVFK